MVYNIYMKILDTVIKKSDLQNATQVFDGPMVKGVVDIEKGILAIDAEMHADLEQLLLSEGSEQDDLWGINQRYEDDGEDFVEFDSMINVRPRQGNMTRGVDDVEKQGKILEIVRKWVQ